MALVKKFTKILNKNFEKLFNEHKGIEKLNNFENNRERFKEFWSKVRLEICKEINIVYDKIFNSLTDKLPD